MSLQEEYEKGKLVLYDAIQRLKSHMETSKLNSLYEILVKLRHDEASVHKNFVLHPFLRLYKHTHGKDMIVPTCRSNDLFEYFCGLLDKVSRYRHPMLLDQDGLIFKSKRIMYFLLREHFSGRYDFSDLYYLMQMSVQFEASISILDRYLLLTKIPHDVDNLMITILAILNIVLKFESGIDTFRYNDYAKRVYRSDDNAVKARVRDILRTIEYKIDSPTSVHVLPFVSLHWNKTPASRDSDVSLISDARLFSMDSSSVSSFGGAKSFSASASRTPYSVKPAMSLLSRSSAAAASQSPSRAPDRVTLEKSQTAGSVGALSSRTSDRVTLAKSQTAGSVGALPSRTSDRVTLEKSQTAGSVGALPSRAQSRAKLAESQASVFSAGSTGLAPAAGSVGTLESVSSFGEAEDENYFIPHLLLLVHIGYLNNSSHDVYTMAICAVMLFNGEEVDHTDNAEIESCLEHMRNSVRNEITKASAVDSVLNIREYVENYKRILDRILYEGRVFYDRWKNVKSERPADVTIEDIADRLHEYEALLRRDESILKKLLFYLLANEMYDVLRSLFRIIPDLLRESRCVFIRWRVGISIMR